MLKSLRIFAHHDIVVLPYSLMCRKHYQLSEEEFNWDYGDTSVVRLEDLPQYANEFMDRICNILKNLFETEAPNVHLSFSQISSDRCKVLTGLESDNITEVFKVNFFNEKEYIHNDSINCNWVMYIHIQIAQLTHVKSDRIFIFFLVCRMGVSQRKIAALLGLTQPRISQIFGEVVNTLMKCFVPLYMGAKAFPEIVSFVITHQNSCRTCYRMYYV